MWELFSWNDKKVPCHLNIKRSEARYTRNELKWVDSNMLQTKDAQDWVIYTVETNVECMLKTNTCNNFLIALLITIETTSSFKLENWSTENGNRNSVDVFTL